MHAEYATAKIKETKQKTVKGERDRIFFSFFELMGKKFQYVSRCTFILLEKESKHSQYAV